MTAMIKIVQFFLVLKHTFRIRVRDVNLNYDIETPLFDKIDFETEAFALEKQWWNPAD